MTINNKSPHDPAVYQVHRKESLIFHGSPYRFAHILVHLVRM